MIFAIPYYVIMFQSARISKFLKRKFEVEYGCCNRNIGGAPGKDGRAYVCPSNKAESNFQK